MQQLRGKAYEVSLGVWQFLIMKGLVTIPLSLRSKFQFSTLSALHFKTFSLREFSVKSEGVCQLTCFFLLNNLLPETSLKLLGEIQIWSSLGVKGFSTIEQSVIWPNTNYRGVINHFRWFLSIALPIKPVIWCKLWPWHRWFEKSFKSMLFKIVIFPQIIYRIVLYHSIL